MKPTHRNRAIVVIGVAATALFLTSCGAQNDSSSPKAASPGQEEFTPPREDDFLGEHDGWQFFFEATGDSSGCFSVTAPGMTGSATCGEIPIKLTINGVHLMYSDVAPNDSQEVALKTYILDRSE